MGTAFSWWNPYDEIDIEYSRWGNPGNPGAQFVAQPYDYPGNLSQFSANPHGLTRPSNDPHKRARLRCLEVHQRVLDLQFHQRIARGKPITGLFQPANHGGGDHAVGQFGESNRLHSDHCSDQAVDSVLTCVQPHGELRLTRVPP